MKPSHDDVKGFDHKRSHKFLMEARNEMERDEIIRKSEKKLLLLVFTILGVGYMVMVLFEINWKWYGICILVAWIAFSMAIVWMKFREKKVD